MKLEVNQQETEILMVVLSQRTNYFHVKITECMGDDDTAALDTYVVDHGRVNQLIGKIKSVLAD